MRARPFWTLLALITVAAYLVRVVYILNIARHQQLGGDALTFHLLANLLGDGRGFISPQQLVFRGIVEHTAEHPPLYPLLLGAVSWLGGTGATVHRLASALMGTGTVFVVGLLGRRIAGERAGLAAAGVAAVYPLFIVTDGTLLSESLYGLLIALVLLVAYRLVDRPTPWRAAVLGGACALAALTRSEASLLILILAVPLAWRGGRVLRGRRVAAVCAAFLLVLSPWLIRTWIVFNQPVWISTNSGTLIAGANCSRTYYGPWIGLWQIGPCIGPAHGNEAQRAATLRSQGVRYARHHASRVPLVVAVRMLRIWDFYRPNQQAGYETLEQRDLRFEQAGVGVYYALLPLAIYGLVLLRRRGQPLIILLSPAILVTLAGALGYGITRLRMAADVSIVVLAAVAMVALLERLAVALPPTSETLGRQQ
jgi:4-amino-4-deoxy-L-arabinose transferase-like glycosyltransferase